MGRTSIVLDDSLVAKCQKITGITTRRGLVDYALRELLAANPRAKFCS